MDDQHTFNPAMFNAYLELNREAMETTIPQNIYTEMDLYERYERGEPIMSSEFFRLGMLYEAQARDYQMKQIAVTEYTKRAAESTNLRRYAITEKGYVAWVPNGTVIGDKLHIVGGARVPYVLREIEEKEVDGVEAVELIGDAYVHGLMTGLGIYEMGILEEARRMRIV